MTCWTPPQIDVANWGKVLKPEIDWTKADDEASLRNLHALNAIFDGVDKNVFVLLARAFLPKKRRKFWHDARRNNHG